MRLAAIAFSAGVTVGASGWVLDHGPLLVRWTTALAIVWLVGAFAVGCVAGGAGRAAAAGAGTIVVGVGTYYVLFHFVEGAVTIRYGVIVGVAWSLAGALIGAVMGWAGDAWRRGGRQALGAALLSGALVGEAMLLLTEWHRRPARIVLLCELVAGAALPYLLARRKLAAAVALTAVVAVVVAGLEQGVRDAMRAAGWRGA
jgi:hypothetical protein